MGEVKSLVIEKDELSLQYNRLLADVALRLPTEQLLDALIDALPDRDDVGILRELALKSRRDVTFLKEKYFQGSVL